MTTNLLLAKLAIESCQQDLTHLCAVTHLASEEGEDMSAAYLRQQTILSLIRAMNYELALMQENIEETLSAEIESR